MKKQQEITVLPPQQEIAEIKEQISLVEIAAKELQVNSQEDMSKAADILYNVKLVENLIEERKILITKPLMASLASVRGLFAPLETAHKLAKQIIKEKMLAWSISESDRIQKEQARIAARVAKGTMRADTAAGKIEVLGDINVPTEGESGKSSIRDVKKIKVVDEFAVPREYLQVNLPLVTEAILRKGATIPGVEIIIEKIIVSRSKHDHPNLQ